MSPLELSPPLPQQSPEAHSQKSKADGELVWTRYDSFSALRFLQNEWDDFVERVGGDAFTSFDWCEAWWNHFGTGRQLEIHLARHREGIAAIVPFFHEMLGPWPFHVRTVRIIGCDHCVTTCGPAIQPERIDQVACGLVKQLERMDWDLLHFGELPGYTEYSPALARALSNIPGLKVLHHGEEDYPHMVFPLPADMESYLAQLSLKERRNVRKDMRDLESSGARFKAVAENELQAALIRLADLHERQWRAKGRLGHFRDWPKITEFHREFAARCAAKRRLALVEVECKGALLASEYAFCFGPRMHWLIGARRPDVSSRVGVLGLLNYAFANSISSLDALPGYYDYKRRLGAKVLGVKNILVVRDHVPARFRYQGQSLAAWLLNKFYHHAWYWKAAPWLRRKMPHLLGKRLQQGLWPGMIRRRFLVAASPSRQKSDASASE